MRSVNMDTCGGANAIPSERRPVGYTCVSANIHKLCYGICVLETKICRFDLPGLVLTSLSELSEIHW